MKKVVVGIVAHVDSGKTTLSEALLYVAGKIRKLGRVDHQDAYLDTDPQERQRGITIFSKQAQFSYGDMDITLLDTPGHVDFSAEMERTLSVLDYAILVINGMDGVQSHTETLWQLLKRYEVPVFIFVNKMDVETTDKEALLLHIKKNLDDNCVDFHGNNFYEEAATCSEAALEEYLETGRVSDDKVTDAIKKRSIFPCFFGSALKLDGVQELLAGMEQYMEMPVYDEKFSARVFKISRDFRGDRLTHLKLMGGVLKCRDIVDGEKINQIRVYSGMGYETVDEAKPGMVCAVTGLSHTFSGQGLGACGKHITGSLEPVLVYRVLYPEGTDAFALLKNMRQLEEENPTLHVTWDEVGKEIHIKVMGAIELQVLAKIVKDRFKTTITFGPGQIVYKETIKSPVMGVGHFEPLRHYAEVHLLMEPQEAGTGLQFDTICSEDMLDRNWQRLILTHLAEKDYKGVLTGAPITDMKITITAGKAHTKHTEGGDFRQATYRAVRQGLMMSESVLLEPVYRFVLKVPQDTVGRAMADITRLYGSFEGPEMEGDMCVLTGKAPVAAFMEYHKEVMAYTHGLGRLSLKIFGYEPCHNEKEVVEAVCYDAEADNENPSSSVFCAHGAGYIVDWYDVYSYMHVKEDEGFHLAGMDKYISPENNFTDSESEAELDNRRRMAREKKNPVTEFCDEDELMDIFVRTYGKKDRGNAACSQADFYRYSRKNQENHESLGKQSSGENLDEKAAYAGRTTPAERGIAKPGAYKKREDRKEFLLVDGYNIIFAWQELKELAEINMDAARDKLIDMMCNYQGFTKCELILVFDAYKVRENKGSISKAGDIYVVYTKEAETADMYIEKTTHQLARKHKVTVASSDGLEQLIIMGQGALRMSAKGLLEEVERVNRLMREQYIST